MFSSFTWAQYSISILIILGLYYLAVVILYYGNEILKLNFKQGEKEKPLIENSKLGNRYKNIESVYKNQMEEDKVSQFEGSVKPTKDSQENPCQSELSWEAIVESSQLPKAESEAIAAGGKIMPSLSETDDTLLQARDLMARLEETIAEAAEKKHIKEEFVSTLQHLIRKFLFLKQPFLVQINNLIASECEKYGYIKLSAEERVMLWNE